MKELFIPFIVFIVVVLFGVKSIKREQLYFNNIPILDGNCSCVSNLITDDQCDSIYTIHIRCKIDMPLAAALYYEKGFIQSMKMTYFDELCSAQCQFEYLRKRIRMSKTEYLNIQNRLNKYKCLTFSNNKYL